MAGTPQTPRDKELQNKRQLTEVTKKQSLQKTLDSEVEKLSSQLILLDDQIASLQKIIDDPSKTTEQINAATEALKLATSRRDTTNRALISAQLSSVDVKASKDTNAANVTASFAKLVTSLGAAAFESTTDNNSGRLNYNASAVKEAYFSTNSSFVSRIQSPNNLPTSISQAKDLWTAGMGSKGMIVTSEQVLKAWNAGSNSPTSSDYFDHHNYGFQFQYNPGTVAMSYYTSPNVDVTMITSGTEMFNLAGVSGSQGSISFQVIINRIFDMQYYDENGAVKSDNNIADIYAVPPQTIEEAKSLYEKGTMYDVEYLLRVLMGTTMNSYLRGERTADMGWLPAIPVELHLGKSLRYLGTVNNVNLNHIIFDSRMVPVFTTMDIGFARLPDYPAPNVSPGMA
jgi:hypothetical protein